MTSEELYDYITQHLTPEEALKKLLESALVNYEKLKFDDKNNPVHPVMIIAMAAMDLGWSISFDTNCGNIEHITVGKPETMGISKCYGCGAPATCLFPIDEPDLEGTPYCQKCIDEKMSNDEI